MGLRSLSKESGKVSRTRLSGKVYRAQTGFMEPVSPERLELVTAQIRAIMQASKTQEWEFRERYEFTDGESGFGWNVRNYSSSQQRGRTRHLLIVNDTTLAHGQTCDLDALPAMQKTSVERYLQSRTLQQRLGLQPDNRCFGPYAIDGDLTRLALRLGAEVLDGIIAS